MVSDRVPKELVQGLVLAPNNGPRVQGRSERSERSERAERCSEHSRVCWPRWAVGRGICGQDQHTQAQHWLHIPLLRWMSSFETKIKIDIPRFQHVDFSCFGLIFIDFGLMLFSVGQMFQTI